MSDTIRKGDVVIGYGQEIKEISHLKYWRDKEITYDTYLMLTNLHLFAEMFWAFIGLPALTDTQKDICQFLQHGYNPDFEKTPNKPVERILITGYRGMAKSYLTLVLTAWRLYRDPSEKILVISATIDRATSFIAQLKAFIKNSPTLQHLKPKKGQVDSSEAFDVAFADEIKNTSSVKAVGIFGTYTGFRATLIIKDDVEVEANSLSPTRRARLESKMKEAENLIEVNDMTALRGRRIVVLGTPQTQDSIYNKINKKGYKKRVWPARYPVGEQYKRLEPDISPRILQLMEQDPTLKEDGFGRAGNFGRNMDERYTEEELLGRELALGASVFNREYMLDINFSESEYPFSLSNFIVDDFDSKSAFTEFKHSTLSEYIIDELQDYNPSILHNDKFYRPSFKSSDPYDYEYKILVIDPAGQGKDETTYCVLGVLSGFIYIIEWSGYRYAKSERSGAAENSGSSTKQSLDFIIEKAIECNVNSILVETNAVGQAIPVSLADRIDTYKNETGKDFNIGIEEVYQNLMDKKSRLLKNIKPMLESNKLVLNKKIIEQDVRYVENVYAPEFGEEEAIFYSSLYQLTRFRDIRGDKKITLDFDDRIDVLSTGIQKIEMLVAREQEKVAKERRDQKDIEYWTDMKNAKFVGFKDQDASEALKAFGIDDSNDDQSLLFRNLN